MLARIGLRIGNMFGKPIQTLHCCCGIEFAAKIQCQSVVEFQRALLAGRVGDVMDGFALCVEDVESAQMTDVGHGGEVVLEAHGCPF